jgi:non-ribosomal peptide synthase protein (TIGR01720 family)
MELDISRTIGWFTSMFPIILDISHSDQLDYQIKFIKETRRNVPQHGIGYGLLRDMTNEAVGLTWHSQPQIAFNYLGQFDQDIPDDLFSLAEESPGENISPASELTHDLSISGIIVNNRFKISVTFSPARYNTQTIEKFVKFYQEELGLIISHCHQKDEPELTPSDLSYTELGLDELDDIIGRIQL